MFIDTVLLLLPVVFCLFPVVLEYNCFDVYLLFPLTCLAVNFILALLVGRYNFESYNLSTDFGNCRKKSS